MRIMNTDVHSQKKDKAVKLQELQGMVHDEKYLECAIQRIAQVLSCKLVEIYNVPRK